MKEIFETNNCARSDELVAYLYNEASADEARDFQNHLSTCTACREELAAFGQVRERIVEWRDESLGALHSTSFVEAPAPAVINSVSERKRSALAALREFFMLSPTWLRAATAFASLLFCVLAVIAISHFTRQPTPQTISQGAPPEPKFTAQELNSQAEKLAQDKFEEYRKQQEALQQATVIKPESDKSVVRQPVKRSAIASNVTVARNDTKLVMPKRTTRPLTAQEREQLAEDLGLAASKDEDDLPRLSDVLGNESN